MPLSEKLFLWVGSAATVVLVGSAALFITWMLDREPPLKAVSGQFVGWDNEVPRRGHVVWRGIQVRSECTGTIYRYIVNGEIVALPPRLWEYRGPIDNPEESPRTWEAPFDVPQHINHDAAYRNRIEFICNPLHKYMPIIVPSPDVPFELREEDKEPGYIERSSGRIEPGGSVEGGGTE